MLKLKLQYFRHLMQRMDSLEKTLMLGKIEGRRRRGRQRMKWLDGITNLMDMSLCKPRSWWWTGKPGVLQSMGSQRVGHDWATELKQSACFVCRSTVIVLSGSTCAGACVWARLFYFFPHEIPLGLERVTDKLWVSRPKYWALNQKWVRWNVISETIIVFLLLITFTFSCEN